jgi:tripartite-type tricarboxylate transporter receptor subunit TctC
MIRPVTLTLAFYAAAAGAAAQTYPAKPVRLIAPFPAGGPVDAVARMIAPRLSETFKQPVVVDNRPGANGSIGIETCVRAAPDGYTMMIVSGSYAASAAVNPLPYHPVNDVTPVVLIGNAAHVLALHAALPIHSVKALIAHDKANPGRLNYGSSGSGGSVHLATELFNQMAGTRLTHVPYKGQGPALNDLLGGQIQLMIGSPLIMLPHIKSHRLRGLAVSSATRSAAMPDLPPIADSVPGYEAVSWQAILGPKALAPAIVARWNGEINRILQTPDFRNRLTADAMELVGGPPARFSETLKRDVQKWQRVAKVGNIGAAR